MKGGWGQKWLNPTPDSILSRTVPLSILKGTVREKYDVFSMRGFNFFLIFCDSPTRFAANRNVQKKQSTIHC